MAQLEKVVELPGVREYSKIARSSRLIHLLIAFFGVAGSTLACVYTVGVTVARFEYQLDQLKGQTQRMEELVNRMRDNEIAMSLSVAGFQIEITNLKRQLEEERQERLDDERRRMRGGG